MKHPTRISFAILILSIAALACVTSAPVATSAPTVIFVPVTVTTDPSLAQPAASVTPEPSATAEPSPTATVPPATATEDLLHFYVSGTVWHDTCAAVDPVPNPLPIGCRFEGGLGMIADGLFQAGEPGISGVTVRIELDCNYGAFTVQTDSSGFYKMSFTVPRSAGIGKQRICLSVDAGSGANAPILGKGIWTVPATKSSTALIDMVIPVETQNTVSFGWDYK